MRLTPNKTKIVEAILFLIQEAHGRGNEPSQYDIVKALFEADTAHLNRVGRPVTFDNYYAMKNGPVASESYEMLKPSYNWASLGFKEAPWSARQVGPQARVYTVRREPNLRLLSRTDQAALSDALSMVIELGFAGMRDRTHKHPAWRAAWARRGDAQSVPMDPALLYDEPDEELAEDLAYVSAHA